MNSYGSQHHQSSSSFIPQYFEIREVGKTIKSTKKQYVWRFKLEGSDQTLEMFTSVISGKKKVVLNGQIIYYDKKYSAGGSGFHFPFNIKRHQLMIAQMGDKFDLRVDNLSFNHLWDLERQKRNVTFEHRDQIDPYKAKDYAQNYDRSTDATSRDQESSIKYQTGQQYGMPTATNYMAAGGFTAAQSNNHSSSGSSPGFQREEGGFGQPARAKPPVSTAKIGKNGEIVMSEEELQMQIEMYKRLQTQSGKQPTHTSVGGGNQQKPPAEKFGFDHGFGRFDTYSQANSGNQVPTPQAHITQKQASAPLDEFDFNFNSSASSKPAQASNTGEFFDFGNDLQARPSVVEKQEGKPALDFFNDLDFGQPANTSTVDTQSEQQQKQPSYDFGIDLIGGGAQSGPSQPAVAQQITLTQAPATTTIINQPPAQASPAQPKFIPNINGFYTANQPNAALLAQQQMMMQQQMLMQQQMMMGMYTNNNQNAFQTNSMMNQGGMIGGQPNGVFGGMPNQQQQQYYTGMNPMMNQQQQFPQASNVMMQQQYPVANTAQQQNGTPFDMF